MDLFWDQYLKLVYLLGEPHLRISLDDNIRASRVNK
jgi:hypothetical protein